ncbi:MAG: D-glycerate dehydrogenase [Gemmatimonadales bacterium]
MPILIASELRELLDADPLPGHGVEWIAADQPTPTGDYEAIVPLLSRRIGDVELDGLPRLRIVANCAVGYDNIDLAACAKRDVVVTNTPDVLTEATADLTWALILATARRFKEAMTLVVEDAWTGWHPQQLLGLELSGKTLGIVGAGRIGSAVARRAVGFGMTVLYGDTSRNEALERETGARLVDLDELLALADVVSVHVPSTPETRGLFDAERFGRMKPGAVFVNTARGDIVDEAALIAALEDGHMGGAGLDVFADEPAIPRGLAEHPRVLALPHIGSATTETRRAMAGLAVENVRRVLAGEEAVTPVG